MPTEGAGSHKENVNYFRMGTNRSASYFKVWVEWIEACMQVKETEVAFWITRKC